MATGASADMERAADSGGPNQVNNHEHPPTR